MRKILIIILVSFCILKIGLSAQQLDYILRMPPNSVFTFYENALNDSSTSKDVLFSSSGTQSIFFSIPKDSNIINATFRIRGYFNRNPNVFGNVNLPKPYTLHSIKIDNITADSFYELALVTGNDNYVRVYNMSNGALIWQTAITGNAYFLDVGEVRSDIGKEVLVTNGTALYIINSTGAIVDIISFPNTQFGTVTAGDVNGDGIDEIWISNCTGLRAETRNHFLMNASGSILFSVSAFCYYDYNCFARIKNGYIYFAYFGRIAKFDSLGNKLWEQYSYNGLTSVEIVDILPDAGDEIIGGIISSGSGERRIVILNDSGYLKLAYIYPGYSGCARLPRNCIANFNGTYIIPSIIYAYEANTYDYREKFFDLNLNYIFPGTYDGWGRYKNIYYVWDIDKDGYDDLLVYDGTNVFWATLPKDVLIDVGNDSIVDTSINGPFFGDRLVSNITAFQKFLNSCTTETCNVTTSLFSSRAGRIIVDNINITYVYNVSKLISQTPFLTTDGIKEIEYAENDKRYFETFNISILNYPQQKIRVKYVGLIDQNENQTFFNGTECPIVSIGNLKVCNLTAINKEFDFVPTNFILTGSSKMFSKVSTETYCSQNLCHYKATIYIPDKVFSKYKLKITEYLPNLLNFNSRVPGTEKIYINGKDIGDGGGKPWFEIKGDYIEFYIPSNFSHSSLEPGYHTIEFIYVAGSEAASSGGVGAQIPLLDYQKEVVTTIPSTLKYADITVPIRNKGNQPVAIILETNNPNVYLFEKIVYLNPGELKDVKIRLLNPGENYYATLTLKSSELEDTIKIYVNITKEEKQLVVQPQPITIKPSEESIIDKIISFIQSIINKIIGALQYVLSFFKI